MRIDTHFCTNQNIVNMKDFLDFLKWLVSLVFHAAAYTLIICFFAKGVITLTESCLLAMVVLFFDIASLLEDIKDKIGK